MVKFPRFIKRKKFWKRLLISIILTPVILFVVVIGIVYWKQDALVQELLTELNADFKGEIRLKDSHVSPFENFPYISIDLEDVQIFEGKKQHKNPIAQLEDVYIGFDLFNLLSGKTDIKSIKASNGKLFLTQHEDGSFNIANALSPRKKIASPEEAFHLDLQSIILEDVAIKKLNEVTHLLVDIQVDEAKSSFKTSSGHIRTTLDSKFVISIISHGKPTIFREKHVDFVTQIDFDEKEQLARISPTEVHLEKAFFGVEGSFDVKNDMAVDLKLSGDKPNFNLFIALAPPDLIKVFEQYENRGQFYFKASVKGKTLNGQNPAIQASFGCRDAFFSNEQTHKKVDGIRFKGYFTNGHKRTAETMEFGISDFNAKPETGKFSGFVKVRNFDSPDVDMRLVSDFNLDFLAKFVNSAELRGLNGGVKLTMNFHDIIDLQHPERSISKLNESYYTKLEISNLRFKSAQLPYPIKDIDLLAVVEGHEAILKQCNVHIGNTDVSLKGSVSDLPAIIHHTDIPVTTHLDIAAKLIDLEELSKPDAKSPGAVDEQIKNMRLGLSFVSTARNIAEAKTLPLGEFYIDDLYAQLRHYPHVLHDFHADIIIGEENFNVVDFTGQIDKSDFHFSGGLKNYDMWFDEKLHGDTKVEFDLSSKQLRFEDLFVYKGERFIPEDYRHEELDQLKLHGRVDLHFNNGLKSTDLYLDRFSAKMKMHHSRIEYIKGRIHLEDDQLTMERFEAKIGRSSMLIDAHYFLGGEQQRKKHKNWIKLNSAYLDFDELSNYQAPQKTSASAGSDNAKTVDHDNVFSLYDLPFPDMRYDLTINHLKYHKYNLHAINAQLHTETNHKLHIDHLDMKAAGGSFHVKGYFSGKDKHHIYFQPTITMKRVNLDQLLFKFDNFGQDHIVSENLHGSLSGTLTGKIRMHADMTPIIDESDIKIDIEVLNGKLENYAPLSSLSDYFQDKNLKKILFDSLVNSIEFKHGTLIVPRMGINTSLGYMEFSGKQDMNMNMEYYISVPLAMVTQTGFKKLFGRKQEEVDPEQEDAVQYRDRDKKMRFVTVKMVGNAENYSVSLSRQKKHK